ncbi:23S rRNA (adenine(1618)-N(6))-methyltransferase RlmF [Undibacterium sp. TS12]|uniref:23S rRNA (adenine(1618)-N(6))-methyltransferase RlmF n=1 Tax=Undibacterium sp. TS12 TaxID=2908202 RepID=UPI001F4D005B|nr:23S rRNA (adenine(1618)-N(6))-methyltransferase RlmF [Undibacterium sp. TS12]MCH8617857.1 23S rRNA (adenine(1618)-N(6))-methyltransferase RlmF [Undibacterium sp. TS12]
MSNQSKSRQKKAAPTSAMHPRNRHQGHYDFAALIKIEPALGKLLTDNPMGQTSMDFSNPLSVKLLNKALLHSCYGIHGWDLPAHNLCPPVPGRADYLHYLADLLATGNMGRIPTGENVHALDIGTGASCIYPLIGSSEYGWRFTATDINTDSLGNARQILAHNPELEKRIDLRLQEQADSIFNHIIASDDWFDVSLCNPPFHRSAAEARAGSLRKWENLGKTTRDQQGQPVLNFSGRDAELWCKGGELAFIQNMIRESAGIPTKILWFSSLVSKSSNMPGILDTLKQVKVCSHKTIIMSQGNKESRLIAWTFLNPAQHTAWAKLRWSNNKR